MELLPNPQYETFEGEAIRLADTGGAAVFRLAGHNVILAARRPPALNEGEYVRVLARRTPEEAGLWRVRALQRCGSPRIEYVGRRNAFYAALLAAAGFTTGFYTRIWWLMFLSAFVLFIPFSVSNREHDVERRFEAYCRACPVGTLRS
jgi:hypothetical protein